MHDLLNIILLGIVQGVTEFLPVSSSGHLVILGSLMDINPEESVQVVIVLHAGTLAAIIAYYLKGLLSLLKPERRHLILKIVWATVPAGILGMLLHVSGISKKIFDSPYLAGMGLIVTGGLLFFGIKDSNRKFTMDKISFSKALLIGTAQALAIFPGISRSGATISTALKCGVKDEDAAEFSFFMAVPAIFGAVLVESVSKIMKNEISFDMGFGNLAIGFIVSAVTGYFALKLLITVLRRNRLSVFACYCFVLGIITVASSAFGFLK